MDTPRESEVPDGAAVFPLIPPELGVHPLLLAVLHAVVFLQGSDDDVIHGAAAEEALEHIATYLQRLEGDELRRVREDLRALAAYGAQEKWPKAEISFLKSFLSAHGIGTEEVT